MALAYGDRLLPKTDWRCETSVLQVVTYNEINVNCADQMAVICVCRSHGCTIVSPTSLGVSEFLERRQ